MSNTILANLNSAQRDAVSSKAQQLAILAGPGSGKTHTLTSRVAWLLYTGLQPQNIIVTTFTRKAANEMKERIGKRLGNDEIANKLVLGTFHSISIKYLRVYGHLIGLKKGFGVADSNDSLSIIKRLIKRLDLGIDPKETRSKISTRKATGGWGEKIQKQMQYSYSLKNTEIAYTEYEAALERDNLLDFDDLLVRCVQLFRDHPECVANVEAVLIDEFQDTNLVQFDLMRLMAQRRKRVTIVGDPDQSIYGFRSAEVKNYASLIRQYPDTLTISLEENYRSSGQILEAAMKVIQQDESRIKKTLLPTHVAGTTPVLRTLADADREGEWIASEIKRCLALTAKLMTYGDISVLVRSAFLSMRVENAFGKAGIPYRMASGNTFYERLEIKIILNYMRVVSNPENNEAFVAVVNEPKRKVGDASVEKLMLEANERKVSIWSMVENGPMTLMMSSIASNGVKKFMNIINVGRKLVEDADEPCIVKLIEYLIKAIDLEGYLKKNDKDDNDEKVKEKYETRMENLSEFITIAQQADDGVVPEEVQLEEIEDLSQGDLSTPLATFLSNIALATDKRGEELEGEKTPKVTISTMHAAKGLEWPIVFVPGCFEGGIPNSRGAEENMDEERRIFYVAMTRAKALLYLSYPKCRRARDGGNEGLYLSNFLDHKDTKKFFAKKGPSFIKDEVVHGIARILRLEIPNFIIPDEHHTLLSLEDDGLPEDGSEERPPNRWNAESNWSSGGKYGQGQTLEGGFARPMATDRKNAVPSAPFRPSYKITMQSMPGFSSAKQVLKELPPDAVATFRALKKRTSDHIVEGNSDHLPELSAKKVPKVEGGQRQMHSFFQPKRPPKAPVEAAPKRFSPAPVHSKLPGRAQIVNNASYSVPSIDPSLRQHRIGGGSLLPPRNFIRPGTPTDMSRPYGNILSSSPQKPQQDEENIVPVTAHTDSSAPEPVRYIAQPIKYATAHMTTMDRLAASRNNGGKKTLGAKMSHNGWANRKSANKPPSSTPKMPTAASRPGNLAVSNDSVRSYSLRCHECAKLPQLCGCPDSVKAWQAAVNAYALVMERASEPLSLPPNPKFRGAFSS